MNHKSELHLTGLHYQLSEHFIFNVMNTLRVLIRKDPQEATSMLNTFSEYLRYALHKTKSFTNTVEKELEGISLFLHLQEIRFKKKIVLESSLPSDIAYKNIPAFVLQPFTEQLLKHAIPSENHVTQLFLSATKEMNKIHITFSCNAAEKTPVASDIYFSPKSDAELGCEQAIALGYALYGEQFEHTTQQKDHIYSIHLQIPV